MLEQDQGRASRSHLGGTDGIWPHHNRSDHSREGRNHLQAQGRWSVPAPRLHPDGCAADQPKQTLTFRQAAACGEYAAPLLSRQNLDPQRRATTLAVSSLVHFQLVCRSHLGAMADHYDLIVIGGGSGGLAASKAAAKLGKRVRCRDSPKIGIPMANPHKSEPG